MKTFPVALSVTSNAPVTVVDPAPMPESSTSGFDVLAPMPPPTALIPIRPPETLPSDQVAALVCATVTAPCGTFTEISPPPVEVISFTARSPAISSRATVPFAVTALRLGRVVTSAHFVVSVKVAVESVIEAG